MKKLQLPSRRSPSSSTEDSSSSSSIPRRRKKMTIAKDSYYNQTCSVMRSACCANHEILPSTSEVMGMKPLPMDGVIDHLETEGTSARTRRRSNLWSEKETSRRDSRDGDRRRSISTPIKKKMPWKDRKSRHSDIGIGTSELIGIALPCGREHVSINDEQHPHSNDNGRSNMPFASSPLLDRGDSLVQQSSLLSLIASDTMETIVANTPRNQHDETAATPKNGRLATRADDSKGFSYATPKSNSKVSGRTPPNPNATPNSGRRHRTPPRRSSSTQSLSHSPGIPPHSPAMELSMAKQSANMAQMSNVRIYNRETLRQYRTSGDLPSPSVSLPSPGKQYYRANGDLSSPSKKARSGGAAVAATPNSAQQKSSATLKALKDGEDESPASSSVGRASNSRRMSEHGLETIDTAAMKESYHSYFENARFPPLWEQKEGINSELVSTYQCPRLYLRDPAQIIEQGEATNKQQHSRGLWWFHLAQRMETTLKHIQDDHWKALLEQHHSRNNSGIFASDSISAASSSVHHQNYGYGCAGLENAAVTSDGCVAMKDLCLGEEHSQQPQLKQNASKPHKESPHCSNQKSNKGASSSGDHIHTTKTKNAATSFQPSKSLVNVWSEPLASTIKVRGATYSKDGIKVPSESSIFMILGVDSFVSGKNDGDNDNALSPSFTERFLGRWRRACEDVGLNSPLFLLIFNFIVPWGNFQMYLIRPDADEGPFSSHKKNCPDEKAWRAFMEGSTEYRNKHLKLIPRVCAGPWMVKKMVGSTPAIIGNKLPVSYSGSISENYLKITLDVTKGPAFGNSVANTVVGKADMITIDLGFVIEGKEENGHLPERILGLARLHHLDMKKAPTQEQWERDMVP